MAFLELQRLSKRFGDVVAVDGLDLSVEQGEFVSLLGPSGCGKTTTLQMIAGFEDPTGGEIRIAGRDMANVRANRRGIGIVFQSYALFPHMTVEQNVGFGLEMRKVPAGERAGRVAEALELVRLGGLAGRYPRALSGGQQQRVALARALVIKPDLLLLDEPLSNLDAKLREEMQIELRNIQQSTGVTTVLVTHDQTEAMALSDRIAVMHRGHIVQISTPFEAYEFPKSDFVSTFLGKTNLVAAAVEGRDGDMLRLRAGDVALKAPAGEGAEGDRVLLSIRPEKIRFADPAEAVIRGHVKTGVFLGNQWLFQIDSPLGELLVVHQNAGRAEARAGEEVGLAWEGDQVRVLSGDDHG
ncbi:ABC transporter ATP-binding protein [Kaustia mangrovi]|uniref:ABC transporter ATP-binding protein n=1 Tax=Kaustia mangrovi TaxID=2593653 RepID=A0A7S8HBL8_9HYPH|nr:ABC transporter ATP-binding protein [Kaustia mangrovi]QPC42792.1 ABC transporter ATP-binding protein [Kaustia mangrovi]